MDDCLKPVSEGYSIAGNGLQDIYLFTKIKQALKDERLTEKLRQVLSVSLRELQSKNHHIQIGRDQWLSALDSINAPVFLLDCEHRIIRANQQYAKCAGMGMLDIIGKPYWQVFPRREQATVDRVRCMKEYQPIIEELAMSTGQVFYDHGYTVYDSLDRACYSLHLLEDSIEREQSERRLRNQKQGLLALRQVNQALIHSVEENVLSEKVCQILSKGSGYRFVWIGYIDQETDTQLRPVAWNEEGAQYLKDIQSEGIDTANTKELTNKVIHSAKPVVINEINAHDEDDTWREWSDTHGFRSVIMLPLIANSKTIGVLCIYSLESDAFEIESQNLLLEVADDLAFGIAALRHRLAVSDHEAQMRALIEHNPDAILILDTVGNIQFVNPAAEVMLGRPAERLLGNSLGMPMAMGEAIEIELLSQQENGALVPRSAELRMTEINFAQRPSTLIFMHDITEMKRAEYLKGRMGRILEHLWNEIYTFNVETLKFVDVSTGAQQSLGYSLDELREMTPIDIKPEFSLEQYQALIAPLNEEKTKEVYFESEQKRKDGSCYPVEVRLQLSKEEYPPVYIAIIQDNSERSSYIAELEHKALFDTLTDLPNRRLLNDKLNQYLMAAQLTESSCAVLSSTVLRMGEINDLMGYANGDLVLMEVARRLQIICGEFDTLAKQGDNEFVLVLPNTSLDSAKTVAQEIKKIFESPIVVDELPLEVEVVIGIAIYPEHASDNGELLKCSDIAMRVAKHKALGMSVYNPEDTPYDLKRLKLHGELRRAIENNEMEVFYQPKVDIKTGHIIGVEALARWRHPEDGMISPTVFIPLVEQSVLIRPFTHWVLEAVIIQLRNWKEAAIDLSIAVNLSTRNLLDPDLPKVIVSLLETYQVSAQKLCLEITESALMSQPEQALKVLNHLHEIGTKLSIDDFGTGYSSLAYLKKLPVDEIKIDQSFIFGLIENKDDAVIVHSTIELAHNLGLVTVAEGVESEAIMEQLKIKNCDIAQGFYLSRPLPGEELQQWLHSAPWGLRQG